jgi:hypothetical protein
MRLMTSYRQPTTPMVRVAGGIRGSAPQELPITLDRATRSAASAADVADAGPSSA